MLVYHVKVLLLESENSRPTETNPDEPLKLNPNRIVSYSYRGQGR